MVCYGSCILAGGFIGATALTMFYGEKDKRMKEFLLSLDTDDIIKYSQIKTERRNLFLQGLLGGFILSLIAIFLVGKKMNRWGNICMVLAITFTVSYFYYILMPKKDFMLKYLDKKEERIAWWNVHKMMQRNYHIGFICGVIAVVLICNALFIK